MQLVPRTKRGALTPWSPLHEVDEIRSEMNRLFEYAFGGRTSDGLLESAWAPAVDVIQEADRFVIIADLPGMKREDIDITLNGNTLSISGEKKFENETKEGSYFRSERYSGRFHRSLEMPHSVDSSRIEATYKDGVLTIGLPKSEEAKPKQIKVQ